MAKPKRPTKNAKPEREVPGEDLPRFSYRRDSTYPESVGHLIDYIESEARPFRVFELRRGKPERLAFVAVPVELYRELVLKASIRLEIEGHP